MTKMIPFPVLTTPLPSIFFFFFLNITIDAIVANVTKTFIAKQMTTFISEPANFLRKHLETHLIE